MTTSLVKTEYQGLSVAFTEEGWFNATVAAEKYGKRPVDWLKLDSTKEYITALQEVFPEVKKFHFARKGGDVTKQGTWLHPKLAVRFAQWLDVRFAIWCDTQIDQILRGNHPHYDWKRIRHEATSSFKVMNAVLQLQRQMQGKTVAAYHFSNEARLLNWLLTGEFKSVDRNGLTFVELDLLAKLEERNAVLMGRGFSDYKDRKPLLEKFAADWRVEHDPNRQLASQIIPNEQEVSNANTAT